MLISAFFFLYDPYREVTSSSHNRDEVISDSTGKGTYSLLSGVDYYSTLYMRLP